MPISLKSTEGKAPLRRKANRRRTTVMRKWGSMWDTDGSSWDIIKENSVTIVCTRFRSNCPLCSLVAGYWSCVFKKKESDIILEYQSLK